LEYHLTSDRGKGLRVDGVIYWKRKPDGTLADHEIVEDRIAEDGVAEDGIAGGGVPDDDGIARMDLAEICVVGKSDYDPFTTDKNGNFCVEEGRKSVEMLGQLHDYACESMVQAYRTHCFMLLLLGPHARILHWSHSMLLASKSFSLQEDGDILACFLHAYARASAATRGWDQTYRVCKEDDAHDVRQTIKKAAVTANDNIKHYLHKFEEKLIIFTIPSASGSPLQLVAPYKPYYQAEGMFGRSTRGYPVFLLVGMVFAWFKVSWRIDQGGIEQEGVIYEQLHKKGVRHIPTIIAHGDIVLWDEENQQVKAPHHSTRELVQAVRDARCDDNDGASEQKWDTSGSSAAIRTHTHYGLLIREIGRPLDEFMTPKEAVYAIMSAILGQ
jgi:hypothetical protein